MQTDGHRCNDVCVWTNWNGDDDEKYIPQIIEKCSHTKNNNQCHRNPNSTDHESIIIIIICARWIVNHDALFRIEFGKMKTQHTTTERNREKETQTYTVTQSHGRRNFHAVFKLQKVHTHTHEVKAIFLFGSKQLLILLTEIIGSNCRQIPDIYRCLMITLRFDQNQFDSEGILKKKSSSRKLPNFLLHSPRTAYQLKTDFAIGIKNYLFTWQNSKFH